MSDAQTKVAFQAKTVSKDKDGKPFVLNIAYGNGARRTFDLTKIEGYVPGLTGEAREQFEHGCSQTLGDIAARFSKARDYAGLLVAVDAAWHKMTSGETLRPDLAAAVAKVAKLPLAEATQLVARADKATCKLLAADSAVALELAEIAARRLREEAKTAPKGAAGLAALLAGLKPAAGSEEPKA